MTHFVVVEFFKFLVLSVVVVVAVVVLVYNFFCARDLVLFFTISNTFKLAIFVIHRSLMHTAFFALHDFCIVKGFAVRIAPTMCGFYISSVEYHAQFDNR